MAVIDFNNLNNNHTSINVSACPTAYRHFNMHGNQMIPMQPASSSTFMANNNVHATRYQAQFMMEPPRQFRQQVDMQRNPMQPHNECRRPKEVQVKQTAKLTNQIHHKSPHMTSTNYDFVAIKSKIGVEFRRYALNREDVKSFDYFYRKIESFHHLSAIPFLIFYTDSEDFSLPINNDDNLAKAISSTKSIISYSARRSNNQSNVIKRPFLKIYIEKKGSHPDYYSGVSNGKFKKSQHLKGLSNKILSYQQEQSHKPLISMPENFRQVSSIIDVDIVPETCRRVRIVKHGTDRPLGFYIRDGTYWRMNARGQLELVTGVFISRLVPGGLAESTGLLAVNDEVLEVNGIQVTHGKTLDQVTDMMVANSSNLIITIRPGKINFPSLV